MASDSFPTRIGMPEKVAGGTKKARSNRSHGSCKVREGYTGATLEKVSAPNKQNTPGKKKQKIS